jgi:hypothetical protein
MPATILSDNGASSGTAGLKTSGSNDGILELQTTTGGGTATAAITIDTGQRSKVPTTIGVGGATPATSGSGISFPASASASSDANTLDDYEEGTWTPNQGAGLSIVGSFSSSGSYTKIGRLVMVNFVYAGSTSVAVSTNALLSSNLPFTSLSTGPRYNAGSLVNYALTSGGTCAIPENTANLYSATAISATAYLMGTIIYVI